MNTSVPELISPTPEDPINLGQFGYTSEWALAKFFPAIFKHGLDQMFRLVWVSGLEHTKNDAISSLNNEIEKRNHISIPWRLEQTKEEIESCQRLKDALENGQIEYHHFSEALLDANAKAIDAGVIHTTNQTHLTYITQLIETQKHVLSEKPLIVVTDENHIADRSPLSALESIVEQSDAGIIVMDAEHYSAKIAARLFFDNVDSIVQTHGKIREIQGSSLEIDDPHKKRTQHLLSKTNKTGLVLDMGVHYFGVISSIKGKVDNIVSAKYGKFPGYSVETYARIKFEMSGKYFHPGAFGKFTLAKFCDRLADDPSNDEVKQVKVTFVDETGKQTNIGIDYTRATLTDENNTPLDQYHTDAEAHEYVNILKNFYNIIRGNKATTKSSAFSLDSLRAIYQVYEAFPVESNLLESVYKQ